MHGLGHWLLFDLLELIFVEQIGGQFVLRRKVFDLFFVLFNAFLYEVIICLLQFVSELGGLTSFLVDLRTLLWQEHPLV